MADEACTEARTTIRLDPEGPYLNNLARAAFLAERYEEAMDAYERNAARGGPSYLGQIVVRAAACSLTGHHAKARELVQEMLREQPDLCLEKIPDVRGDLTDSELEKLREGLRLAGLPE